VLRYFLLFLLESLFHLGLRLSFPSLQPVSLLTGLCLNVCVHRAHRMVDILSARLQDVYTKWESRSKPNLVQQTNTQFLSYAGLRCYGHQERHRKRGLAREASREVREIT